LTHTATPDKSIGNDFSIEESIQRLIPDRATRLPNLATAKSRKDLMTSFPVKSWNWEAPLAKVPTFTQTRSGRVNNPILWDATGRIFIALVFVVSMIFDRPDLHLRL
jgi:hypothetical protein